MKKLGAFALILMVLSACDVYVAEPRYDVRDRMVGYYDVEEYSATYDDYTYYTIRISKDVYHDDEIYLHNFYGADITVHAIVSYDRITIPYQVVKGYAVEGTGERDGNELFFHYSITDLYDHSYTNHCDVSAWRD